MRTVRQLLEAKAPEVFAIGPDAPVIDAIRLMAEKRIGALLVMQAGKLAGIVSERDYARKIVLQGRSSRDTPVRDIMTADVVSIGLDDTTDTMIVGKGTINLKDETLDLTLRPRPKDRSLLVFRSPLIIDGSFKDPGFHPDMGRVGLRAAIALVLGNIAPPAALLATLELGPGEDIACGGKYAK